MHQSDNLSITIVSPPLNNLNYPSWSRSVIVSPDPKINLDFLMELYKGPMNVTDLLLHALGVIPWQ